MWRGSVEWKIRRQKGLRHARYQKRFVCTRRGGGVGVSTVMHRAGERGLKEEVLSDYGAAG